MRFPYRTIRVNFGVHLTSAVKRAEMHTRAGYYIYLEPGDKSMLAGGSQPRMMREKVGEERWKRISEATISYLTDVAAREGNTTSATAYIGVGVKQER